MAEVCLVGAHDKGWMNVDWEEFGQTCNVARKGGEGVVHKAGGGAVTHHRGQSPALSEEPASGSAEASTQSFLGMVG